MAWTEKLSLALCIENFGSFDIHGIHNANDNCIDRSLFQVGCQPRTAALTEQHHFLKLDIRLSVCSLPETVTYPDLPATKA